MHTLKAFIFFSFMFLLLSCSKNEFSLDFNLEDDVTENYNVTYYATDKQGGRTVQAVASVREGKCLLDGVTKLPTLAYITARRSPVPLVVYVEAGKKISVTGGSNPLEWKIENGEFNKELTQWREENLSVLTKNDSDSINMAVARFVEESPSNPVGLVLLACYYDRRINEREFTSLMFSLKDKAKDSKWIRMVARADQYVASYSFPARLQSLVMRSNKEGADTLKMNGKDPALLVMWQTGYDKKKTMVDSLKALMKEIPDSARFIADICVDADSVGWKSAIRKDSLDKIKRLWAPLSLADPTLRKFKVGALPFFIVFDKEGTQAYRGSSLSEALECYRSLLNEKG